MRRFGRKAAQSGCLAQGHDELGLLGQTHEAAVAVARRTREIGIRIALGATPRHVLRSIFARAGRQLGR